MLDVLMPTLDDIDSSTLEELEMWCVESARRADIC